MRLEIRVCPPYPVWIEAGALERLSNIIDEAEVALISDSGVAPHHLQPVRQIIERAGKRIATYTVEAGEESKSLATFTRLHRSLVRDGFDRRSAILALGGGIVSDLAGFVASSFMRGVPLYLAPTTLLAMVDASIGGKTAVNLPEGKNLVGAFWQPKGVVMDVQTLATLPIPLFRDGAVELFKHGLLADPSLCRAVLSGALNNPADETRLVELIGASVKVKAEVVSEDVHEASRRAFLNLGHTLGHAIEAASNHSLRHGEAVTYGLLFAGLLGRNRGWYDPTADLLKLCEWLSPRPLPHNDFAELLPYIDRDKKRVGSERRFVLLKREADPVIVRDVDEAELRQAWKDLLEVLS